MIDTWEWDCVTQLWEQKHPINNPPERWTHSMEYIGEGKILIYGGYGATSEGVDDTWIWDGNIGPEGSWIMLEEGINISVSPSGRGSAAMAYNPLTDTAVLYGGFTASGRNDETWLFGTLGPKWYDDYDFASMGVTAYWPFDGNANDVNGNGFHGTAVNTSQTCGLLGQYYDFIGETGEGASSRVELPDYTHTSAVSYAAWIKLERYATGVHPDESSFIFHRRVHYSDQSLYLKSDGTLGFYNLRGTSTPNNEAYSSEIVTLNEWHHVVGTMDDQFTRIYLDGQLVAENPSAGAIYWDGSYYCPPLACTGTQSLVGGIRLMDYWTK